MSDFDEVLERLVADPGFRAALSTDPGAALHDYHLDDEELAVLRSQLDSGDNGDRLVEERVSKSGLFGMVGPVVSALGFVATPEDAGVIPPPRVPPDGVGVFGPPQPVEGVGVLETPPHDGAGAVDVTLDPGGGTGTLEVGEPGQPMAGTPAVDYETRVDADGDGRWDAHRAVEDGAGGVDILVDRNDDGVVDWVAHDRDRDGLIEEAEVDMDYDGSFETRFVDDTGDGWLDRRA